jgi:hypothetical protein
MSLTAVQLNVSLGPTTPLPAPADVMEALIGVEINRGNEAPSGFQMTFNAARLATGQDYGLVASSLLKPWNRVVLSVTVNGLSQVLMDGFITRQELTPGTSPDSSILTVTGEDISVKMNLFELSLEYPAMGDFLIAEVVLAKYLLLGVIPDVQPTLTDIIPFEYVPQQNCTDLCYLKQLAQRNGYVFYIKPSDNLTNYAYWGPPVRSGQPQPALTVDSGPLTNVNSLSFAYDALAPTLVYGMVLETMIDPYVPLPVLGVSSTRTPPLATDPALSDSLGGILPDPIGAISDAFSLTTRGTLFQGPGLQWGQSQTLAQAMLDLSVDKVVTVQGEIDVTRYEGILSFPGVVGVRGAGLTYDGLYSIDSVSHKITSRTGDWSYKQSFTLTREGTGTTVQEVEV